MVSRPRPHQLWVNVLSTVHRHTDILINFLNLSSQVKSENQALQGRLVDALARRGYERRGTLRKALVRCEQPLTRRSLNGETHLYRPRYFSHACMGMLSRFVLGINN